jgi:hypothetical protein
VRRRRARLKHRIPFVAHAAEEASRVFWHAARIKKPEKSAIANHGNRFRKIDLYEEIEEFYE